MSGYKQEMYYNINILETEAIAYAILVDFHQISLFSTMLQLPRIKRNIYYSFSIRLLILRKVN